MTGLNGINNLFKKVPPKELNNAQRTNGGTQGGSAVQNGNNDRGSLFKGSRQLPVLKIPNKSRLIIKT